MAVSGTVATSERETEAVRERGGQEFGERERVFLDQNTQQERKAHTTAHTAPFEKQTNQSNEQIETQKL